MLLPEILGQFDSNGWSGKERSEICQIWGETFPGLALQEELMFRNYLDDDITTYDQSCGFTSLIIKNYNLFDGD